MKHNKRSTESFSREEFNAYTDKQFYTFCYESALIAHSGWYSPTLRRNTGKGLRNSKKPESLFDLFDSNKTGRVSLAEFKQPFKDMDRNSNYKIERSEIIKWLQVNNIAICKPYKKRIAIQLENWQ
jgi:hypothetical protein